MKNYSLILLFIFTFSYKKSNAQSFEWAKRAGLYAFDLGYGVGADNAGNVYIAGKYEMNAYFGGIYVGCAGNHDMYLAKYGPTGDFKWVRTAGGPSGDYAHAIVVDGAGNSYVTGEYEMTTLFGSIPLSSNGGNDIFVAKYDTNGNLMWVKKLGGGSVSDKGLGISLSNGNVYVTGNFQKTANFAGVALTSAGIHDIFVAKYTTDGVFQWVKKAGGPGEDEGYAISNDPSGNVYVTGYFTGTANFSGALVTSYGGTDAFIAKYNSDGGLLWVKKAGAGANDAANAIKVDKLGKVFITGGFRYTSHFGTLSLTASGGNSDIFVACYDASGNAVWAKKAGGGDNDAGRGIAVDASSNIFITGNYGKTATFGTTTISGADITEIFFASYDVSGNFRWVLKAGGVADASDPDRFIEMGLSICTDPTGNIFASGAYRSNSTFGGTTLNGWSTHTDVYVTKIKQAHARKESLYTLIEPAEEASYCSGGSVLLKTVIDSAYSYKWKKDGEIINAATTASYKAAVPGSYEVIIIKGKDTVTSDPTVVTESTITAEIITTDSVFCKDKAAVLSANNIAGYNYSWKRNGEIISGATLPDYKPTSTGNYQVGITNGECSDWSDIKAIRFMTCTEIIRDLNAVDTALNPVNDSILIKVYPNPNNGLFTFEVNVPEMNGAEKVKVEVVNAIGQVVYSKFATYDNGNVSERIELARSIPTGIYFLKVSIGERVQQTRIMLTK